MARRRLGDRRTQERYEIVGNQWGAVESIEPVRVVDFTPDGALLDAPFILPLDSVHRLQVVWRSIVHHANARVRHVRPVDGQSAGRHLIGVEFLEPLREVLEPADHAKAGARTPHWQEA